MTGPGAAAGDAAPDFSVGQAWETGFTAPSGATARLEIVIGRIDRFPALGERPALTVVSVAILPDAAAQAAGFPQAGHAPFSEKAARAGARFTGRTVAVPGGFQDGYDHWRAAFDAGKAGLFTISTAEACAIMIGAVSPSE